MSNFTHFLDGREKALTHVSRSPPPAECNYDQIENVPLNAFCVAFIRSSLLVFSDQRKTSQSIQISGYNAFGLWFHLQIPVAR